MDFAGTCRHWGHTGYFALGQREESSVRGCVEHLPEHEGICAQPNNLFCECFVCVSQLDLILKNAEKERERKRLEHSMQSNRQYHPRAPKINMTAHSLSYL
jgi:hypothetical protein